MQQVRRPLQRPSGHDRSADIVFGQRLRHYRLQHNLTQEQLAWSIGMSRVFISELERGIREPSLGTILRLAGALGISSATLLAEVESILSERR
ncbi:MAG: helix-turn-helix transcriptional regulator [Chlorobi bacterium]|nr:helix-turn-helix transcriptional regulator [Chlorobiota bacterium]MBX7216134.1 helix-turn-helix transcriptional regulator [Candidatus Kapabacteria bacterium]